MIREGFEARVKEVAQLLHESQAHVAHETHLQEEIGWTTWNPHASLKKALEEVKNIKFSNQCLRKANKIIINEWGLRVQQLESSK